MVTCLFEHLTVSNFLGNTVDNNWLVPGEDVFDKGLVFWVGDIQLLEVVGFPIWSNIEGWLVLFTSDQEDTDNTVVVVFTVNNTGTEQVLGGTGQSVEETTQQVVGHEGQGQFVVVLVVDSPDGPFGGVKVFP
ncbi:hypothetical protein WICPIJ_000094 [Wickerhamomyces pijperi]|uniref:Uncharacterized protein n=1 Tax=Wickerhamomyces pijperi TaxID=599730 RepID=A0A9P8TS96_WICPI|nr:hypothetical protein WICPIJ_000094 [Wickerhamomyces pijperi]